jgi:hypothetical protein
MAAAAIGKLFGGKGSAAAGSSAHPDRLGLDGNRLA